ncbi:dolichyl-phosphate beta-glucosyltransferase [Sorochytrium milnesiophthora]
MRVRNLLAVVAVVLLSAVTVHGDAGSLSSPATTVLEKLKVVWSTSPRDLANTFLDVVDAGILALDRKLNPQPPSPAASASAPAHSTSRRYEPTATTASAPQSVVDEQTEAKVRQARHAFALDGGEAFRQYEEALVKRDASQSPSRSPECSGYGWYRRTSQMYNCFGQQRPAEWLPDLERKNYTLVSCTTCAANDRNQQTFACSAQIASHNMTCSMLQFDGVGHDIYSDPACTKFSLSDTVTFGIQVQCADTAPLELNAAVVGPGSPPDYYAANFTYFARRSNQFAMSSNPAVFLSFRIFNLYRLSDTSLSGAIQLDGDMLSGNKLVNMTLNFADITSRTVQTSMNGVVVSKPAYLVGGRLYLELGFGTPLSTANYQRTACLQTFVDFHDLPTALPAAYVATGIVDVVKGKGQQSGLVALYAIGACFVIGLSYSVLRSTRSKEKLMYAERIAKPFYLDTTTRAERPFAAIEQPATCKLTVVVPAYNEAKRLPHMLADTLRYLGARQARDAAFTFEIIVVDDGSLDATVQAAREFAQSSDYADVIKVLVLPHNRGKGGAVTQGVLCASGELVLFADADGATRFSDLELLEERIKTLGVNGVAVGSRAHLVKTDAVVKRSVLRNVLMYSFHAVLYVFGIRHIRDTQCGFKLFTRPAARRIFPNVHVQGWIFDIELLLLAQYLGIPVAEVCVHWHEVDGSKMSLAVDSVRMLVDLLTIRACYATGLWSTQPLVQPPPPSSAPVPNSRKVISVNKKHD